VLSVSGDTLLSRRPGSPSAEPSAGMTWPTMTLFFLPNTMAAPEERGKRAAAPAGRRRLIAGEVGGNESGDEVGE